MGTIVRHPVGKNKFTARKYGDWFWFISVNPAALITPVNAYTTDWVAYSRNWVGTSYTDAWNLT